MRAEAPSHEERIDFVLAVGGDSVADGTTFIVAAMPYEGDLWKRLTGQGKVKGAVISRRGKPPTAWWTSSSTPSRSTGPTPSTPTCRTARPKACR